MEVRNISLFNRKRFELNLHQRTNEALMKIQF